MKLLLDIHDDKAQQVLNLLKKLPYVKTTQLTEGKAQLISEIKEAVEEMNLILEGKKEARDASDFLNDL